MAAARIMERVWIGSIRLSYIMQGWHDIDKIITGSIDDAVVRCPRIISSSVILVNHQHHSARSLSSRCTRSGTWTGVPIGIARPRWGIMDEPRWQPDVPWLRDRHDPEPGGTCSGHEVQLLEWRKIKCVFVLARSGSLRRQCGKMNGLPCVVQTSGVQNGWVSQWVSRSVGRSFG